MTSNRGPNAVTPYVEDGCARRWPLLVLGLGMPVLFVFFIACGLLPVIGGSSGPSR